MCILGYIPTPLTVKKMVCFYFYHPGGAPGFSWFLCVYSVVFLVHSYVFLRAFSGVFLVILLVVFFCFSWCFFHCVLVFFFRAFFRACPFSFVYTFPLSGSPAFCRAFFRGFWVSFLPCFFSCGYSCYFWIFIVLSFVFFFFVFFFVLLFFVVLFFVQWVAPKANNHNILHFGPCFFWWLLLVKIGYTQCIPLHFHLHPTRIIMLGFIFVFLFVCFLSTSIRYVSLC